jgi:hypothetical protein
MNYAPIFDFIKKHELLEQEQSDALQERIGTLEYQLEDICRDHIDLVKRFKQLQNKHMRFMKVKGRK